jgi:transposase-like protein
MIAQWQASGLSVRAFCGAHDLREPSFYAWRRTLAQRDRQRPAPPPATPSAAKRSQPTRTDFVPVHVISVATLEVIVRTGQSVRVGVGFDAAHLRAVVTALEAKPC